ncbi:MAG TPA: monovalent cation/H(+) antiporter subunit G [Micromonosporaceae bacterium]|nr:monovalent cation/H(+) antiporter subunit G [Micromonosporaceae bacterium]
MSGFADVLSAVCLVLGALLSFAAGVGVLRFPDVLSRMHASAKPQVLGLLLILLGVGLRLRTSADVTMLLLVGVFQLMTAPVAAHIVCRASYRSGRYRSELLIVDEIANPPAAALVPSAAGRGETTQPSGPDGR